MVFTQTGTDKYNKRIELQSAAETRGATGEIIKTWSTFATVWSRIRTLTGTEKNAARQVQATQSHEITIRYSSDVVGVAVNDRIVYGSRIFDIKDIRNVDEMNIEIRMLVTESMD